MNIFIDLLGHYFHHSESGLIVSFFNRLVSSDPSIQCTILVNANQSFQKPDDNKLVIQKVKLFPGRKWGKKLFYGIQLPSLLKKQNADLFIGAGSFLPGSVIPQICWMEDGFMKMIKRDSKSKRNLVFITTTVVIQKKISEEWSVPSGQVYLIRGAADENATPLSWTEKESVKTRFSGGKEYFLVAQSIQSENLLVKLLKAFSQFKKRQQTNMQLVITGLNSMQREEWDETIRTFKFTSDVHFYIDKSESEILKIVSGAYVMLEPFENIQFTRLLNAFASNTPVILNGERRFDEITEEAVEYIDATDTGSLTASMMTIFTNENKREQLIQKARSIESLFKWQPSIDSFNKAAASVIKN